MWLDRLTGEQLRQLPVEVAPGRYWTTETGLTLNGHTPDFSGLLVDDGSQRCLLGEQSRSFNLLRQTDIASAELLFKAITTIDVELQQGGMMVSPLMPAAIVDDQGHLQPFEEHLQKVVAAGHLHRISQRPRLDMHYEDEVTDIARARRLSKGALVHLASHSECWQRQTLSGVIPRKVMARFSKDDYGIYENRVYARILEKIERYLRARLSTLNSLRTTLEQAMEFYRSPDINHWLANAVCDLWGKTFDEESTSKVTELLTDTLHDLQLLYKAIRALQKSGLYTLVDRNAQVASGLHRTNILSHDPDYRHVAALWESLGRSQAGAKVTPSERFKRNRYLAEAYSRYAGLVLRRALQPYLAGKDEGPWAGRTLTLRQQDLDWELVSAGASPTEELVLLTVVPWLTFSVPNQQALAANRFIAWPAEGQELPVDAFAGQWIPLSPSDMYCEERFGLLVDRALQRLLLENYCQPLEKVPTAVLGRSEGVAALHSDQRAKKLQLRERLADELMDELRAALHSANAVRLASDLLTRNEEIKTLQICPVCKSPVRLAFQSPSGFKAGCAGCGTDRYLRGQNGSREYEQLVAGERDFRILGRRAWAMSLSV
ncbi:MAG: hypothetical protein JKY26_13730 [Pseudomonas sp.]|nr:hypothetical protein [Pseudomonas sp.]